MLTDLTLSEQAEVKIIFVCSIDDPLGAIHPPNIMEAYEGGRRSKYFLP